VGVVSPRRRGCSRKPRFSPRTYIRSRNLPGIGLVISVVTTLSATPAGRAGGGVKFRPTGFSRAQSGHQPWAVLLVRRVSSPPSFLLYGYPFLIFSARVDRFDVVSLRLISFPYPGPFYDFLRLGVSSSGRSGRGPLFVWPLVTLCLASQADRPGVWF